MSSPLLHGLGGAPEHAHTCSRAGCGEPATRMLHWRNPKIHPEGRRKTWLACDDHMEFLSEFLRARDFPLEVELTPDRTETAS